MGPQQANKEFKFLLFEIDKEKEYAKITINRPEVMNALNIEVRLEMLDALSQIEDDDRVRAVVLTGAGEKAFSAGADIKMFLDMTPETAKKYLKTTKGVAERIETFPKPVIAAINGFAIGGGLELALACDIAIASENAKFGQTELNVGLIPGVGGTQRLPRIAGLRKAKELVFTGKLIDSAEALRIGIVNRVVPPQELFQTVEEVVKTIAAKSPIILSIAKEALNKSASGLKQGLDFESVLFAFCFSTFDQKEGARAFLEKRSPKFKGS